MGGITILKYDDANPLSIKEYGERLIGKKFSDVIQAAAIEESLKQETITKVNNPNYKGGMGHLIEKYHFEYEINSDQEPDFPKAGVELKVTPYEIGTRGAYRAGERLVITMISYQDAVEEKFSLSHAYKKLYLTLFVHYLRNRLLPRSEYSIDFVTLFTPPEEDLKIMQQDYEKIIGKIKEGKAHELSEGDTMYLGACTKGSTAAKSLVPQLFYAPDIKAPKRAFCFKQSYMTHILKEYVLKNINTFNSNQTFIEKDIPREYALQNTNIFNSDQTFNEDDIPKEYALQNVNTYERILSNTEDLESQTFENLIVNKINQYKGKTDYQLCEDFDVPYTPNDSKGMWSSLSYRMLGVKSNRAEEFIKADIEVKTIRLGENGKNRESISFPTFSMKEFAVEEWDDSDFYNILSSKRFLFVVFSKVGDEYILKGCQLWNMSVRDLEIVRNEWETCRSVLNKGLILQKKYKKDGTFTITNNFPNKLQTDITHIRPHASERYYVLEDGEVVGQNPAYGDELPDGRIITKQSFWLNNTYILNQLDDTLKI